MMRHAKQIVLTCIALSLSICFNSSSNSIIDPYDNTWNVVCEIEPSSGSDLELIVVKNGDVRIQITSDLLKDEAPHAFISNSGNPGIVWSRQHPETGNQSICLVYLNGSGTPTPPFTFLTEPEGQINHSTPILLVSDCGTRHLVYIETQALDGQQHSSIFYRNDLQGTWSEPQQISAFNENVIGHNLLIGSAVDGFPLLLQYNYNKTGLIQNSFGQIGETCYSKMLLSGGGGPQPWDLIINNRLPMNPPER
jgi:hypothetical protein